MSSEKPNLYDHLYYCKFYSILIAWPNALLWRLKHVVTGTDMFYKFLSCVFIVAATTLSFPANSSEFSGKIDNLFSKWDNADSPGCALGVVKEGELVYQRGYGLASLEHRAPITPESVFLIAGTGKQFVAASISMLVKQGKLSLDDEIHKYFPDFPTYKHPIRIRDLVYHTAGLRDYLVLMDLGGRYHVDEYPISKAEILDLIYAQKDVNFQPSTKFEFDNTGYLLMAELVRTVSGQNIEEFARDHLFQPLGMSDTRFEENSRQVVSNRVTSYSQENVEANQYRRHFKNFHGWPSVLSTVKDLYLWDQNFYRQSVGGDDFINLMLAQGMLNNGEKIPYASGLKLGKHKGLDTISHEGIILGFRTEYVRFPEKQLSIILLCNLASINPMKIARDVADLYLAEELTQPLQKTDAKNETKTVQVKKSVLESYTGRFVLSFGMTLDLTLEDRQLYLETLGNRVPLKPTSSRRFEIPSQKANIVFSKAEGLVLELTYERWGYKILGKRIDHLPPPTKTQLEEYSGRYYSGELDAIYEFAVKDDALVFVKPYDFRGEEVVFAGKDWFAKLNIAMTVQRDKKGFVSGLIIESGPYKNIVFLKQ